MNTLPEYTNKQLKSKQEKIKTVEFTKQFNFPHNVYRGKSALELYAALTKADLYSLLIDFAIEFIGEDIAYNQPYEINKEISKRLEILFDNDLIINHDCENTNQEEN